MIRGGRTGYDRLQVLARVRAPETNLLLDRVGVRAGMRCIDLGCGGGDVTMEIARRVGPDGEVIGLDMDEVKLRFAREQAERRGFENVEFRAADVDAWSEDGAFDLVYSRFLLEHVADALGLLGRMWAAVRPGGGIAVEDGDFDGLFCEPSNAGYEAFADLYRRVLVAHGGDPTVGRKLYRYSLAVGIPSPESRLVQDAHTSGEGKSLPLLTLEATADAIRDAGLATDDELDAALTSLAAFTDDPATLVSGPRVFQVWGRRSPA